MRLRGWWISALAIAGAAAFAMLWSAGAAFASGAVVSTCDYSHLQAAIASADGGQITFACSGTITVPGAVVVPSGQTVWLDGSGESVTLSGGFASRVFDVEGGSLKLAALTVSDGRVFGDFGTVGSNGADGDPNGTLDGSDASPGGPGVSATGGAIFVAAGSTVELTAATLRNNEVTGGGGGAGGSGGAGVEATGSKTDGRGGAGAAGGAGGDGLGGAIYNAGTLTVTQCVFLQDQAVAGGGGAGGAGGSVQADADAGGNGGAGGAGGGAARVAAGRSSTRVP